MAFEPIKKNKTIVEMVLDQILTHMATGKLKPGDVLPVESRLAETFKIGKSTIREALRILEAKGIVEVVPRKGIIVRSIPEDLFESGGIDLRLELGRKHLPDLLDFLVITVVGGAELACNNRDAKDLKKLKQLLVEIEKCVQAISTGKATRKTYERYAQLYLEFYSSLNRSTHNIIYIEIMNAIFMNLREHLPLAEMLISPKAMPNLRLDQELVGALEAQDVRKARELSLKRAEGIKWLMFDTRVLNRRS